MTCRRDNPVFLITALAFGLASCGRGGPDHPPLEQARAELAAGNAVDAQVKLEKLISGGTDRTKVAAYLGEAALAQGDLNSAYGWLADEHFSPETRAHGLRMLGRLYLAQGNLADAGRAYDRSLALTPGDADLWVDIGRLRYFGGEQLQAIDAAKKAVRLDPKNAAALQFRGQLVRDAQGLNAGADWFGRALKVQPGNISLRSEYAATLGDAGRAREALAALRGGGGKAVGSPQGLFVQAVIAARAGQMLLARELLQRSGLESEKIPAAMMLSAVVDIQAGNFASATQTLDELQLRQPDNPRIIDLLAMALSRSGADLELVRRFAALAEGPLGSPYLRTMVGRSFEALDERASAARYLDLATRDRKELVPLASGRSPDMLSDDNDGDARTARDLVRRALTTGQAGLAQKHARSLAGRLPGSADALSILGDADLAFGDMEGAREAYLRSAAVRSSWPLTLRLLHSHSDSSNARKVLEAYVQAHPSNGEAAAQLADAYAAQGRWDKATALLDHAIALGQARVPWVLAARSAAASRLGEQQAALDFALDAHELQPMNPAAITALMAALPTDEAGTRADLQAKLRSLTAR